MRGILGSPLTRGNSDVIDSAIYTGTVVSGAALSVTNSSERQKLVATFDATIGFAGFSVANDLNEKSKTVGFISEGRDIPVRAATGANFNLGSGVFLNSSGLLVPDDSPDAVYQLNGQVKSSGITALDHKGVEHNDCAIIDLFGGGAPFTPTP